MDTTHTLTSRIASQAAQDAFAAFSGDRNPMHMDAVAARRTQAGLPVAHGVQNLMWALETLAEQGLLHSRLVRVRARFLKWVYLEQRVTLRVPLEGADPAGFELECDGMTVLAAELTFDERSAASSQTAAAVAPRLTARLLRIEDAVAVEGMAFTTTADRSQRAYPALSSVVGTAAVAELAACSYVVGMEAPGLHSMFSRLDVTLYEPATQGALRFRVAQADTRFSKLRVAVNGNGLHGTLEAFLRNPPAEQITCAELADVVMPGEFVGVCALVVGGSRGLGEVAAKLIAAGGGEVVVTYAVGRDDAIRVAQDIAAAGGNANILPYDVRRAPEEQLAALPVSPTHLLYFATSLIYRPKSSVCVPALLTEFVQFYVQGFHDLCIALLRHRQEAGTRGDLQVMYPSTVFVDDRPAGMAEYAMMKAAGEQLCKDLNQFQPGIRVTAPRLPRLPTDQTASVLPEERLIATETLLPLLRDLMPPAEDA